LDLPALGALTFVNARGSSFALPRADGIAAARSMRENPRNGPDRSSTAPARSGLDRLVDGLGRHGDRPLLEIFGDRQGGSWTYGDCAKRVDALARAFRRRLSQDARVALVGTRLPDSLLAALAVIRAGAVVVPVDDQLDDEGLQHVLTDSEASWVVAEERQIQRIRAAAPEAEVIQLSEDGNGLAALEEGGADAEPLPENDADSVAALFYTSGTTGPPKGVPLSHGNIAFQLDILSDAGLTRGGDRVLQPLPLHHVYPLVVGVLAPLSLGLTLVIPETLMGSAFLKAIREGRVSVIIGVPRLYEALYDGITARVEAQGRLVTAAFHRLLMLSRASRRVFGIDVGRALFWPLHRMTGRQLRVLASGGAALDPELAEDLRALGWEVMQGYGLTETAPLLTISRSTGPADTSVGQVVPRIELKIDQRADVAAAGREPREGEILARGPGVFRGYHGLPEETEQSFTDDGWFRTGDLGFLDDDGRLHVTGRVSTMIVTSSGENLQPEDLEARYSAHPDIAELGVLQRDGRLVGLAVPQQPGAGDHSERIDQAVADCARDLPSNQRLGEVRTTAKPLPRTRLGKIRRQALESRFEEAGREEAEDDGAPLEPREMAEPDRRLLESPRARTAWQLLAERYPSSALRPETNLRQGLGIDSLAWIDLAMALAERTGVDLDDEVIGRIETARDLLQEIAESEPGDREAADPLGEPEAVLDSRHRRWLEPRGPISRAAAGLLYFLNRALLLGLFRLDARGQENVPEEGSMIIACNHASVLDPFVIAAALPRARLLDLYWGGWTGIAFANPVFRFVSRAAQVLPVDPVSGARASVALAALVLRRGDGLIWFPEGQRSAGRDLEPLRPGIGRLLERHPAPVVLGAIRGTGEAMPPGRRLPRLKRLQVRFDDPVDSRTLAREGSGEDTAERIVDAMAARLKRLVADGTADC
jgi:long-chain acyl-CoA synthetase